MRSDLILILLLSCLISCGQSKPTTGNKSNGITPVQATAVALEKQEITVGGKTVMAEIADTNEKREKGLMFRDSLEPDSGMLFVFDTPTYLRFYMKNTYIPLSIAFIKPDGTIESIQKMEPLNEERRYFARRKALYALEMRQGWFEDNGVRADDHVEIPEKYRPAEQ